MSVLSQTIVKYLDVYCGNKCFNVWNSLPGRYSPDGERWTTIKDSEPAKIKDSESPMRDAVS